MRYYIYLDRPFLRTLFSAVGNLDFNIEVVEYSVRKSCRTNNGISVNPSMEKTGEEECFSRKDQEKVKECSQKNSDLNKGSLGVTYDYGNVSHVETERKYINIEDITNMKNTSFYHDLIEQIRDYTREGNSRICEENGLVVPYQPRKTEEGDFKNKFFQLNESVVWFDPTFLEGDIALMSSMACQVTVIGYTMNCKESRKMKVIKALAIFIE